MSSYVIFGGQAVPVVTSGVVVVAATPTRLTSSTVLDNTMQVVYANTQGGSFTITMPPAPLDGQVLQIIDNTGAWSTHSVTLSASAGQQITSQFPYGNLVSSETLAVSQASPVWRWDATLSIWLVS
jgi:hypothetical protein